MKKTVFLALKGMEFSRQPDEMFSEIAKSLRRRAGLESAERLAILGELCDSRAGDALHATFRGLILGFDNARGGDAAWAESTAPNTSERRSLVCRRLGLTSHEAALLNDAMPFTSSDRPLIVADVHDEWLGRPGDVARREFFFDRYLELLANRGWAPKSLDDLRISTEAILGALSDPVRREAFAARGLVMGYVQSGKTANFAGLIARAADHGYRLFIVLAGTMNILRRQTQRRLDADLLGRELLVEHDDYAGLSEEKWGSFTFYGGRPSSLGAPDWLRLTTLSDDYRRLRADTFDILRPEKEYGSKPLHDPANLFSPRLRCRLLVVKKHHGTLQQLREDFSKIRRAHPEVVDQLPALIIDDESDQASIDTRRPDTRETMERKRVNDEVTKLVAFFPRGQYVGYSATPYANILVNPDDTSDLFPRDFVVSLPRPAADYMGVSDFFDSDPDSAPIGFASRERAFLRPVRGSDEDPRNLPRALAAFVLSGALKLYRRSKAPESIRFRHHTMLIHTAVARIRHAEEAEKVFRLYDRCGFNTAAGVRNLEQLWKDDFLPVSKSQEPGLPFPGSFEALKPFISEALQLIERDSPELVVGGRSVRWPIYVINSDFDEAPDFEAMRPVWKIIVGGSKLSRGYTVEDLTVSYYRRVANLGDTLMQMGRWFGFRKGYRDLVRLFIGDQETAGGGKKPAAVNLIERYRDLCRTEESLRTELERYIRRAGQDRLRPIDVPPLIRLFGGMKITAANKSYYAQRLNKNFGGEEKQSTRTPDPTAGNGLSAKLMKENIRAVEDLLGELKLSEVRLGGQFTDGSSEFSAIAAETSTECLIDFLGKFRWNNNDRPPDVDYQIDFLKRERHGITRWMIVAPQRSGLSFGEPLPIAGKKLSVKERSWIGGRFGVFTESRHLAVAHYIAGNRNDEEKVRLVKPSSRTKSLGEATGNGVMLLYPVRSELAQLVSIGFALVYPPNNLGFQEVLHVKRGANAASAGDPT